MTIVAHSSTRITSCLGEARSSPGIAAVRSHDEMGDCASVESSYPENVQGNATAAEQSHRQQQQQSLGRRETRAVFWLRGVVLTVLLVAAAIVAILTHKLLKHQEEQQFESEFQMDATRLKRAYYDVSAHRIWVSTNIIVRHVSNTVMTGEPISQSTLFDWDYSGISLMHLSRAESIAFLPILTNETRADWERFASTMSFWVDVSGTEQQNGTHARQVSDGIWRVDRQNSSDPVDEDFGEALLCPYWQVTPLSVRRPSIMFNACSEPARRSALNEARRFRRSSISGLLRDSETERLLRVDAPPAAAPSSAAPERPSPSSAQMFPIFSVSPGGNLSTTVDAVLALEWKWSSFFEHVLVEKNNHNLHVVVENTCNEQDLFTLSVQGSAVKWVGYGDHHSDAFEGVSTTVEELAEHFVNLEQSTAEPPAGFSDYMNVEQVMDGDIACHYTVHFYPTQEFKEAYTSDRPLHYTIGVLMIFLFATILFIVYDCLVERRQSVVLDTAVKSSNILHQIYPPQFVNRVIVQPDHHHHHHRPVRRISDNHDGVDSRDASGNRASVRGQKKSLQNFLTTSDSAASDSYLSAQHPIAELFPDVTILFADISGFTAWSSERQPIEVFQLLESIYAAFDDAARKLGVFKVETIGDCYVAVVGLPAPQPLHAMIMCRFAQEIHRVMSQLTRGLEVQLGPGTSDLKLRIGLHSGSVVAGVLRGEKARFQVFGDVMNTTARLESTGIPGMTHASKATADLLISMGKRHWLTPRQEKVQAKGKGELPQTYWVSINRRSSLRMKPHNARPAQRLVDPVAGAEHEEQEQANKSDDFNPHDTIASGDWASLSLDDNQYLCGTKSVPRDKNERLVEWNTEVLSSLLNSIERKRRTMKTSISSLSDYVSHQHENGDVSASTQLESDQRGNSKGSMVNSTPITLPRFDPSAIATFPSLQSCSLSNRVREQLRAYVADVAGCYNELPFHNFEHASHVTLSALKLLNRIIVPCDEDRTLPLGVERHHFSTFGISSDPLTHFVIVFSAMVHDVSHPGVPNSQLVDEDHPMTKIYGFKSIAEQHSIQVALQLLEKYPELQESIYRTPGEKERFYQLLNHSILATDIMVTDSAKRWAEAFGGEGESANVIKMSENSSDLLNLKASIVLEQIIQASDVAHTMQHWVIYQRWNEKLLHERCRAYRDGKSPQDPTKDWYEGELRFFDGYVLPLAKRLKGCGVYGVSSDEYLSHALANREEWEQKGRTVTQEMVDRLPPELRINATLSELNSEVVSRAA